MEGLVQEDSRIDQYPKLVKGESRIVWEWQGNCWLYEGGREQVIERRKHRPFFWAETQF